MPAALVHHAEPVLFVLGELTLGRQVLGLATAHEGPRATYSARQASRFTSNTPVLHMPPAKAADPLLTLERRRHRALRRSR